MTTHSSTRRMLALTGLLLALAGCDGDGGKAAIDPRIKPLPTIDMTIAGRKFTLEVADEEAERQTGLMYRTSMPADRGMLFVFERDIANGFWMKNTLIPLDIAYIESDGRVLHIAQMYPKDLAEVGSNGLYRYAIELNQDTFSRIGLKPGDTVEIPASVKPAAADAFKPTAVPTH